MINYKVVIVGGSLQVVPQNSPIGDATLMENVSKDVANDFANTLPPGADHTQVGNDWWAEHPDGV